MGGFIQNKMQSGAHRGDRRRRDVRRHGVRGDEQRRRMNVDLLVILNDNEMSISPRGRAH